ncbi:MAG: protein-disulfide reductase DsbD domain-containing protein [Phycisphaerae bacterium]
MRTLADKQAPPGIALILLVMALLPAAGSLPEAAGLTPADLSSLSTQPVEPQVTAELFADTSAVVGGETFTVGVLVKMGDGWHVYWRNPGEGGLATEIEFSAPEGFEAGSLQWPVPERFEQPGEIVGFGYSDSVLLTARVTAPDEIDGGEVTLTAVADYLACKDVCIPGRAELSLELPVAEEAEAHNQELFEHWRKRLPAPADVEDAPAEVAVVGRMPPAGGEGRFEITLRWKTPEVENVQFFPAATAAVSVEDTALRTANGTTRIRFRARVLEGVEPTPRELETVVAYELADETRRGLTVLIPLRPEETEQDKPDAESSNQKETQ